MAVLPQPNGMLKEEKAMTITRIDAEARWSDVVIHNQTLYYTGVPANLDADAFEQTANTLAQIDAVLEKQGSDKSRILDATIFLADKSDFAAMNKAWDAWVVAGHAPVRCTVEATLMNPQYKVSLSHLIRMLIASADGFKPTPNIDIWAFHYSPLFA